MNSDDKLAKELAHLIVSELNEDLTNAFYVGSRVARSLNAAVAAERERCALIAENYATLAPSSEFVIQTTMEVAAVSIAATIRENRH